MKTTFRTLGLIFFGIVALNSCNKNDEEIIVKQDYKPSADSWEKVRNNAIKAATQNFTITAGTGTVSLTSAKGVVIKIPSDCLTKNGVAVTGGAVNIDFVELFDKGKMLVTNKPTMGIMASGDKNLLKSGGEFFIKATQGGVELATTCTISLAIPANLTGNLDTAMTLWAGDTRDADNLAWKQAKGGIEVGQGTAGNGVQYMAFFNNFGWTNVDRFYSDPRPKTTILVAAPSGYDNTNSAIYLSYDGEGKNQLAKMDTFSNGLFSEHYGQIPVGLQCHIIFATEDSGQWRYAIKAVTITANTTYTFTQAETIVGTEAQLVAAINAIQ